jgi:phospholipid transport system substrate-binding protein
MMKKEMFRLVPALLGLCLFAFHAIGQTGTATDSIHSMLDEVMAIQNDPRLMGDELRSTRRDLIRKVIMKNFDFAQMAMGALGREQWGVLTGPQRVEFKSIFQDLFLDSYSRLVLDFLKKEKIEYGSEETIRDKIIVKTSIHRLGDRIPVHYQVLDLHNGWLVSDVTIDGVSIVQNYRTSFSRVIRQESYSGLLKKMRLQQKAARGGKERGS